MSDLLKVKSVHLGPAACAVDLGDGSERGEYVNQDYILHKLGRPHRAINLMYCYYPLDKGWPLRANVAHENDGTSGSWGYPYDNYFPYLGGLEGNREGEPFNFMRDVRRHGQDVILTLTIDPGVSDEQLVAIARDLRTFGRIFFRINHEATGRWFTFNKRYSYQEVADFYVRFHKIVKREAPNVLTILCIGGIEEMNAEKTVMEEEFMEAVKVTDIWSVDKYMSLHWGWPDDVAEKGGRTSNCSTVRDTLELTRQSYERWKYLCGGVSKPMLMSECNSDGDTVGPYEQAEMVQEWFDRIKDGPESWFSGFTYYQFRDRGRLGLEIEDPNNPDVGVEQPVMDVYKNMIHHPYFQPTMQNGQEVSFPARLRWGSSEDSDGIAIPLEFEQNPVFCEVYFDDELKDLNLMMEINGHWFYKAPGVGCVDMMSAFFKKPLTSGCKMDLHIFAPPASGENDPSQGADWQDNYYTVIPKLPHIRIRYEAPVSARK